MRREDGREPIRLDREMLQAYRARWQAVAELETAQWQKASLAQRWQKMNALLRMAVTMGVQPSNDQEAKMAIHARWNRLRDRYLSQQQEGIR